MNKPIRSRDPSHLHDKGGFALIITVSLLVLLAVIAVGLLTLSTVTVRTASQAGAQEVARANARLAVMLAIADLQKSAGPDQRVTAVANIAGTDEGTSLGSGEDPNNSSSLDGTDKGLTRVQAGTRYWTGVFSNRDAPEKVFDKTPSAKIERWLVSGIDDSRGATLNITPEFDACAVGADGTVADPTKAAVLVGRNSVGDGPDSQEHYVAAPMVEVDPSAGSGYSGGFAYWVGDEGVKARINMERTNEDAESYASLVAQRRGWETIDGFEDYPTPPGDGDRELPGVITLPTAEILIPGLGTGAPSPRQSVFHSATTESRGLLVDSLNGGTRVDLSSALSGGLAATKPTDGYDNFPTAGGRIIPETAHQRLRHLKWDHLEDFYNLRNSISDGVLKVRERTGPETSAIAPVIADFRILMGVRLKPVTGSTGKYNANPCGKMSVAIANPYSLPLEWDDDLEFEIINQTPAGNGPSRIYPTRINAPFIPANGGFVSGRLRHSREAAVFNRAVFRIKSGRLEPGEARAYTHAGRTTRPTRVSEQIIDLEDFGSAAPFDFNNCVELTNATQITLPQQMDVRETWETTLVMLEMRLGGSGGRYNWLRRVERFELDNGYFGPNTRNFTSRDASYFRNGPIPLMLYSFQISQPGMDYLGEGLMPGLYEMGQRSSTLRTFADFNILADNIHKPIASYNPPPYFMESNDSWSQLGTVRQAGETGIGFTRNLVADPLHWGHSPKEGSTETVLFSVPRQFTSLAQLQHADLTNDEVSISVGHQPGNAFANSYASPFVRRATTEQRRVDYELKGVRPNNGATQMRRTYYDVSHILNNSLWDRYFFSTISSGSAVPENPTLTTALGTSDADLTDPVEAATGLMINGAFNINSTDENAWLAFLASAKYNQTREEPGDEPLAAFPRSLEQPNPHEFPPTGGENDSFSGYRRLSDEELELLATEIVKQVRRRGPFVSLSHFVNRALADINDEPELTRSGALQLALDESGINISYDGRLNGFNDINTRKNRVTLAEKKNAPRADLDGTDTNPGPPPSADRRVTDWAATSRDNNFGAVASILADRELLKDRKFKPEQGYRSTGIPGWVTQADVLQVIGPAISARSDTFRIRTRGEARDGAGNVIATAYCEAIVQRQPYYVDPANAPYDRPGTLSKTNETYGRKFEMVSFRWLSSQEI